MFRRYEPGYHPWYINEEECIFLTHALKQTLFVVSNVIAGQLKMDIEQGRTILRYSEEKGNKLEWHSKEMQMKFPTVSYSPIKINNDVLIQKIRDAGSIGNVSLQVDTCYIPSAVQENKGERPYYPRVFILADQKSGLILDFEMYQSVNDDADVTLNKLIGMCLENGIPKGIRVRSEAMEAILEDLCKKIGIKLKVVKRLPAIDQMMKELVHRF